MANTNSYGVNGSDGFYNTGNYFKDEKTAQLVADKIKKLLEEEQNKLLERENG